MWGAVWMTALKAVGNVRSIAKSPHLLVCLDARKANLLGIQASLSSTPYFQMRYDVKIGCNHPTDIPGRRR